MPGFSPGLLDDEDLQEDSVTEARLWTAIDSLPDKCRGISENTVRNQVSKALRILKEGVRKAVYFLLGL